MKKSTFLTLTDNFEVELQDSLYINNDPLQVKYAIKQAILEVRESIQGKLTLGFSGGTDSIFMLCCFKELIKEGKLTRDAIEVAFFDFISTNSSVNLPPEHHETFRLEKFKHDIDKIYTFRISPEEMIKHKFRGLQKYVEFTPCVHAYARQQLNNYVLVLDDGISQLEEYDNCFLTSSYNLISLREDTFDINLKMWNRDTFCTEIRNIFTTTSHLKNSNYIQCYPEIIYGLPKHKERGPRSMFKSITSTPRSNYHYKQYRNRFYSSEPPYRFLYIVLPNGEKITSVKQTQEFFNRHS